MSALYLAVDITDRETLSQLSYCQTLAKQQIKGNYVDPSSFHITLSFLNDTEEDSELVKKAMNLFKERYSDIKSFYVFAHYVNRFDMSAAWLDVENAFTLYRIKHILDSLMKEVGYESHDKFDEYVPHITLAYDTENFIRIKVPKTPVLVSSISLWNSPKMNGSYVTNSLHNITLN